jgi:hypothetical protein
MKICHKIYDKLKSIKQIKVAASQFTFGSKLIIVLLFKEKEKER